MGIDWSVSIRIRDGELIRNRWCVFHWVEWEGFGEETGCLFGVVVAAGMVRIVVGDGSSGDGDGSSGGW